MFGISVIPMKNIENERLKLLSTLRVLYEERSVIGTADIQGLTQSAVSKQLQKLRDWFEDELFVRTSNGMAPTEKTLELIPRVQSILEQVNALSDDQAFNPADLEGTFAIETTDEVSRRLCPALLKQLDRQSPNLRIAIRRLEQRYALKELETNNVDLVISVNWHAPEQLLQKRLYSDRFVLVLGKNHPLASKKISIKDYAFAKHLLVAPLNMQRGYIDDYLNQQGFTRNIKLNVPDFLEITYETIQDQFIVALPNRVAENIAKGKKLVIKPLPFSVPPFNYYLLWHRRMNNNARNRWMRQIIFKILSENT